MGTLGRQASRGLRFGWRCDYENLVTLRLALVTPLPSFRACRTAVVSSAHNKSYGAHLQNVTFPNLLYGIYVQQERCRKRRCRSILHDYTKGASPRFRTHQPRLSSRMRSRSTPIPTSTKMVPPPIAGMTGTAKRVVVIAAASVGSLLTQNHSLCAAESFRDVSLQTLTKHDTLRLAERPCSGIHARQRAGDAQHLKESTATPARCLLFPGWR